MPVPHVWTERNTGSVGWTDCTYCSILMCVVGSGHSSYPLGIYTEGERKAFRGNETTLNFSAGVKRAKERYGVTVVSPTPMTEAQLKTALAIPNRVWAVAGRLANFPTGHRLRRWQPAFVDFHAVAVAANASAQLTWLDPLAPNGFVGDGVTVAEVLLFGRGNYPNDCRYTTMAAGSGGSTVPFIPTAQFDHIVNRKSSLKASTALKAEPVATSATLRTFGAGTGFYPIAMANDQWYACWLYDDSPAGYTMGYFPVASCTALEVNENPTDATPPSGFTQADIDAAVAARDEDWVTHLTPPEE